MERLAAIAGSASGVALAVRSIRFRAQELGMKMAAAPSNSAWTPERCPRARAHRQLGLDFQLPHFSGSQNLRADGSRRRRENDGAGAKLAGTRRRGATAQYRRGFGIPYFVASASSTSPRSAPTRRLMTASRTAVQARVVIELGRIWWRALYDAASSTARSRVSILITDGGLHHHLAASGTSPVIRKTIPSRSQRCRNKRESRA